MFDLQRLGKVEYEEEARMLETSHSRQVYSLLFTVLSLLLCAPTQAKTDIDTQTLRRTVEQINELRRSPQRTPSAVHSEPLSNVRALRPPTDHSQSPGNPKATGQAPSSLFNRPTRSPSVLETLLKGRAEKWVGNFSPSRGNKTSSSETLSLKTKIHIYKGKIKSNGNPFLLPLADGPKVFSVVNSDEEGRFQVQLPPGEYTLFIELEDGKLYRNSFDGKGNFSTVKLIDGEDSSEVLTDTREATF